MATPEDIYRTVVDEVSPSPFTEGGDSIHTQNGFTYGLWAVLAGLALWSVWQQNWMSLLVCVAAFALSLLPMVVANLSGFRVPRTMYTFIVFFLIGTLVLGEVFDFYTRFWWWDVLLHGFSAVALGLLGVVSVLLAFKGAHIDNPPALLVAFLGFCFAVAVGAIWEIFEFGMDQIFGLNMQKSGLVDTMWDLIVDCTGAMIGASAGWAYLRGSKGPFASLVSRFIAYNHRWAKKRAASN